MILHNLFHILLFLFAGVSIILSTFYQKKGAMRPLFVFLMRIGGLVVTSVGLISLAFYLESLR